jgi:hypothetical protein
MNDTDCCYDRFFKIRTWYYSVIKNIYCRAGLDSTEWRIKSSSSASTKQDLASKKKSHYTFFKKWLLTCSPSQKCYSWNLLGVKEQIGAGKGNLKKNYLQISK